MKVNVLANRVPTSEYETFKVQDWIETEEGSREPAGPEYIFRLKKLNDMEAQAAADFADQLIRRYVTGGYYDQNLEWRDKPEAKIVQDDQGRSITLEFSERAMRWFSKVERMQGIRRDIFDETLSDSGYLFHELAMIQLTTDQVKDGLRSAVLKVEASKKKALTPGSTKPSSGSGSEPVSAIPPLSVA